MEKRFNRIKNATKLNSGIINISGLSEGRTAPLLSLIANDRNRQVLIITSSQKRAKVLYEDLYFFMGESGKQVYLIPEDERIFLNYEAKSRGFLEERLNGVIKLAKGEPCVVIACVSSVLRKIMPKEEFVKDVIRLQVGQTHPMQELRERLMRLGYEKAPSIDVKGQYSIRGDILDIYPYDEEHPIRIEFFDDEVDSIRSFNKDSQRSLGNQEEVEVYPALQTLYTAELGAAACEKIEKAYKKQSKKLPPETAKKLMERRGRLIENIETGANNQSLSNYVTYFYDRTENLTDYLSSDAVLAIEDFDRIRDRLNLYEKEIKEDFAVVLEKGEGAKEDFDFFYKYSDFTDMLNRQNMTAVSGGEDGKNGGQGTSGHLTFVFTPFMGALRGIDSLREIISVKNKALPAYSGRMEMFLEDIKSYMRQGFEIILVCSNEERRDNLKNFLNRNDIFECKLVLGVLSAGSEYTDEKLVYISDADIFSSAKTRKVKKKNKDAKPIKSFVDIKRGDYVVHENHGIGRFIEIQQLEVEGIKRDYLKIKYAGEDMLYVPVDQMDSVQKYIGADIENVKVNKLSGSEWKKTKQKVKSAIQQMAKEIMELSAQRRSIAGFAFAPDGPWQNDFEDRFPYVETDDQLKCTEEIKKDMEKPVPMERLLCGDVGYGKTEVAARAVFKCISDGKQAAILVPTTILASQHYSTFKERLEDFPFSVEMLSRFRTDKQQEKIIKDLGTGRLDVIIGTHRILSKDVKFNDLGLLIIDEEQRFGVQHKEALKMLRKNVDVLTLSATPIPRTLHMSLIGARDMSIIEEAPEERYPVQTYVMEQDDDIIRNAILREMDRDGQVFVVYNRVKDIRRVADWIRELVPEAEVSVGHGRMGEELLENVIIDFVEHKSDVLVCTTIIETGVDMPNANTMIILDADRFGLSQLYQLRGRVGRSNRMAYAYLMYQKNKVLTEVSAKRLTAIKDFTELGSGFKIAMRDLELRGAGNILGTEQSGHMVTVGYELYCKMLEETMSVFRGERTEEELPDVTIELDINAYIPTKYIEDETQRIEIYQKIASVVTEEEGMEIIDELIDRFGEVPKAVQNLIMVARTKALAKTLGIEKITEHNGTVSLIFLGQNNLKAEMIMRSVAEFGSKVTANAGRKPFVKYKVASNKLKAQEIFKLVETLAVEGQVH